MESPRNRKSVLIIKHGYSETCDHNISSTISYGDVFRCTCLLDFFRGDYVTWISAPSAEDLLTGNPLIDKLILAENPAELNRKDILDSYDTIINLEKQRDWCEFGKNTKSRKKFGFQNWAATGDDAYYPESASALSEGLERDTFTPLQDTLFKSIGQEWTGERYSLGYKPKVQEIYDIGFNCHVGSKWPDKAWPMEYWKDLHSKLNSRYTICWQQSLDNVKQYIDWLSSCKLIITNDSLGLHLAIGLNKKIIALFGPTSSEQVYLYGLGESLTPSVKHNCIPCFLPKCQKSKNCMHDICVDDVAKHVNKLLLGNNSTIKEWTTIDTQKKVVLP